MGCCSSQPSKPVPSEVGEWSKYEELVRAIFADPLKGPTEEHLISIRSCKLSALEPENKTDPPLLVVAMDHDEWFRCLIKKCDPEVTWRDGGQEKTLGSVLQGDKFTLWCERMEEWERERQGDKMDVLLPDSPWSSNQWWSEFGSVYSTLGLGAMAGAGIAVGSATLGLGFPLMAVGPLIWKAIKNWRASFERYAPSPDLMPIFTCHTNAVGSTLQELNKRIQVAKMAAAQDPGDNEAKQEYERQQNHVELLQVLLENHTTKMNVLADRRMSDTAKYDEMVTMLRDLLKFQRELNAEVIQEEVSDILRTSESRLASIETLLTHILSSRAPPLLSRPQSPHSERGR